MAALTFPTAANYRVANLGSVTKLYFIFASIADGDTFTVPMSNIFTVRIDSNHTSNVGSSVEKGTATNAGTPLTLHVSATGAGTLVAEGTS